MHARLPSFLGAPLLWIAERLSISLLSSTQALFTIAILCVAELLSFTSCMLFSRASLNSI